MARSKFHSTRLGARLETTIDYEIMTGPIQPQRRRIIRPRGCAPGKSTGSRRQAPVAQWIEHLPPKKGVTRSIRVGGANNVKGLVGVDAVACFAETVSCNRRLPCSRVTASGSEYEFPWTTKPILYAKQMTKLETVKNWSNCFVHGAVRQCQVGRRLTIDFDDGQ